MSDSVSSIAPRARRGLALICLLLLPAGCGDGGGDPTGASLRIVSGSGQADTATTELPLPLVVEVRDDQGRLAEGVDVRVGDLTCGAGCLAFPLAGPGAPAEPEVVVQADAAGRVSVPIRLGQVAGAARVPVAVPSLDLVDTARYSVAPGNAVAVRAEPADTAVYPDGSVTISGTVVDQYGNPRPEPVSYQTNTPSNIAVSSAGVVTGLEVGTGILGLFGAGFSGEATVRVVPPGTIAISAFSAPSYIQVLNLDGTGRDSLVETGVYYGGAPTWSPDGQTIVYQESVGGGAQRLRRIAAAGGTSAPVLGTGLPFEDADYPQYSADGAWVYFRGWTHGPLGGEIWRVHPDGSGPERVGLAGSATSTDAFPTPSPDGTRAAFISDRGHPGSFTLRVLTIEGGAEDEMTLDGTYPRWSPDGTWIALARFDPEVGHGALWVVHPNGSDPHRASPNDLDVNVDLGLAWSPDGAWLLVADPFGLSLVDLEGRQVHLSSTNGNFFPGWKP
jgi:hypothetical protein